MFEVKEAMAGLSVGTTRARVCVSVAYISSLRKVSLESRRYVFLARWRRPFPEEICLQNMTADLTDQVDAKMKKKKFRSLVRVRARAHPKAQFFSSALRKWGGIARYKNPICNVWHDFVAGYSQAQPIQRLHTISSCVAKADGLNTDDC